jgi:hypothetical protein
LAETENEAPTLDREMEMTVEPEGVQTPTQSRTPFRITRSGKGIKTANKLNMKKMEMVLEKRKKGASMDIDQSIQIAPYE